MRETIRGNRPPQNACYDAPPLSANPKVSVVVADPFSTQAVRFGARQFVCVQGFKCAVGEVCPPSE